jgi:hypothetical protein
LHTEELASSPNELHFASPNGLVPGREPVSGTESPWVDRVSYRPALGALLIVASVRSGMGDRESFTRS